MIGKSASCLKIGDIFSFSQNTEKAIVREMTKIYDIGITVKYDIIETTKPTQWKTIYKGDVVFIHNNRKGE